MEGNLDVVKKKFGIFGFQILEFNRLFLWNGLIGLKWNSYKSS